ncbi:electron transfer flavoprotein subunit alpha/FixB family protein [Priestia endophytica]|uniref:Electron transfer flavoprotein subunit alpha n=1 Tax=Priestia endophytica TaxID=135735 RepID=A0AAX1QD24_9BACI|nr:electron transfer flavoprotein subunit alpha/FixB family protein [Priestia endophytica]RAS77742.1 electron transfer flavoprotein subunit alpha [Priestia endophytica]RAS92905.1 electron transfer flavoprotein subunit alpha [Priestia endophytica]
MARKVLALAEFKGGEVRSVSYEAIAAARMIADGGEVVVGAVGEDIARHTSSFFHYGGDRVVFIESATLKAYTLDGFSQCFQALLEEEEPEAIIIGHTSQGKEVAPKLAAKLESGLISDVTDIEVVGENVILTRPIYSGKAFEKRILTDTPLFFTIRPNNIEKLAADPGRDGETKEVAQPSLDLRTVVKEVMQKATSGVDLSEAKVIVAGGRGVKSEEGFKPLQELADVLGGAVGASRGACDAEYCDYSLQIGQTGKVVTPDLYIACGLSGAIQHLAGMSNSKVIVAINKDPEANIFNVADYGIVGDLFEIIPLLIEECKKIKVEKS